MFTCQDTSYTPLNEYTILILFRFPVVWIVTWCFTFFYIAPYLGYFELLLDLFENENNTLATLTTSIILLNKSNGLHDVNVQSEWILNYLYFRLIIFVVPGH